MLRRFILVLSLGAGALSLSACSEVEPGGTGGEGGSGTGGSGGSDVMGCTMPTEVLCSDQVLQGLNLQADITPGLITSAPDGAGFVSNIDAVAGGAFATDPDSFTYGKFTPTGLTKVEISDEQSLDSMDWDVAFRRYVVRINSGHSGPSCVRAARMPGEPPPTLESVTALPEGITLRTDEYFTSSCELIPDGSGLMDSPATALSNYWTYPGCVQMTDNVFIVELASGERVKLVVVSFYSAAAQEQCDTMGTIPMMNNGSGNFVVRWAFL